MKGAALRPAQGATTRGRRGRRPRWRRQKAGAWNSTGGRIRVELLEGGGHMWFVRPLASLFVVDTCYLWDLSDWGKRVGATSNNYPCMVSSLDFSSFCFSFFNVSMYDQWCILSLLVFDTRTWLIFSTPAWLPFFNVSMYDVCALLPLAGQTMWQLRVFE
jgi:hypothetical protein